MFGLTKKNKNRTVTPEKSVRKTRAQKRRRSGSGVIWLIVFSLIASASLRIGAVSNFAFAEGHTGPATEQNEGQNEPDPEIATVLRLLQQREERLAEREAAMEERAQALAIAEEKVRENLTALEQAEADLQRMIALSSEAAEDDLTRLTSVYENMKPKQAALVFAEMAPEFAAGFLGRMRPDAAASIMASIDPSKAYAISVLLAGRNATAPTK